MTDTSLSNPKHSAVARKVESSPSSPGFRGPLFVVGRPRSGTKLLMTLLNEHPQIGIPIAETSFFPSMVLRYGDPPRLDEPKRLDVFYSEFEQTAFYEWRKKFNVILTKEELRVRANLNSWSSVFETILKYHAPKQINGRVIWGDKSPQHLTWIPLLKSVFPAARFLHIVRDPRDACLSAQRAWGKHPYRSADAWHRQVSKARVAGSRLGPDYQEILYESLLSDPAVTLRDVCRFLDVEYTSAMLEPSVSYEELGDATGTLCIVSNNQNKYKQAFKPSVIRRIEEIAYPTMLDTGYVPDRAVAHHPLIPTERVLLSVHDGLAMTRHYSRVKGLRWGITYFFQQCFHAAPRSK